MRTIPFPARLQRLQDDHRIENGEDAGKAPATTTVCPALRGDLVSPTWALALALPAETISSLRDFEEVQAMHMAERSLPAR